MIKYLCTICAIFSGATYAFAVNDVVVTSPGGAIQFKLLLNEPRPRFAVTMKQATVIAPSPIITTLDDVDITSNPQIGKVERYERNETFPSRLIHSTAHDHCNGANVAMTAGPVEYTFEIRAYDDGIAFRTVIPGSDGVSRTPDERTSFIVPAGTTIWHHGLTGHYEGEYSQKDVDQLGEGEWVAP